MQAGIVSTGGVPSGTITLWSGAIVDIPSGWFLCDGNNGTPNLKNRFIIGAGGTYNPGDSGGYNTHTHQIIGAHSHELNGGPAMAMGEGSEIRQGGDNSCMDGEDWQVDTGDVGAPTESYSSHPLNYAYAFIMKS